MPIHTYILSLCHVNVCSLLLVFTYVCVSIFVRNEIFYILSIFWWFTIHFECIKIRHSITTFAFMLRFLCFFNLFHFFFSQIGKHTKHWPRCLWNNCCVCIASLNSMKSIFCFVILYLPGNLNLALRYII